MIRKRSSILGLLFLIVAGLAVAGLFVAQQRYIRYHLPLIQAQLTNAEAKGGTEDETLDWYRHRLLGDGWEIYDQRIPGKLQTLYWKDKWLLTIGHNVSFPMDHPPHARFELLLIWDYWHQLEQTSQDNVEKASK